jgi:hypothetical protein
MCRVKWPEGFGPQLSNLASYLNGTAKAHNGDIRRRRHIEIFGTAILRLVAKSTQSQARPPVRLKRREAVGEPATAISAQGVAWRAPKAPPHLEHQHEPVMIR